jgi:hypothetical protein
MISTETIEAYNSRLTVDLTRISELTPSQRDTVVAYGSQAEALMKNRDLAQFIHHYKFQLADQLSEMTAHTEEAQAERVALANQLAGITGFVNSLKSAVYWRSRVQQSQTAMPTKEPAPNRRVFDPKD